MNKHRTNRLLSLAFVAVFALVGAPAGAAKGLIKIAENDWTGNHVNIWLAKMILEEELDYEVELVFASLHRHLDRDCRRRTCMWRWIFRSPTALTRSRSS